MLLYVSAIVVGLFLLVWGAERMVIGAAAIANNLGVAPMLIGLTVVGFATSAPEILVSMTAALRDVSELAIGNAIGSNIANVGLVIGAAATIYPMSVKSQTLQLELPVMMAASVIPAAIIWFDPHLSRTVGLSLLAAFLGLVYWMIRLGQKTAGHDAIETEYATEIPENISQGKAILWIVAGLILLAIGSYLLVSGSQNLARSIGISELIIGLTVVAVGTSLPELAVSVVAARKGLHGLALGNIIGSNAFNMLAVIGVAAAIRPTTLDPADATFHVPVLLAFTVAFFFIAYNYTGIIRVKRWEGAILLIGFIAYHSYLAQQNF